MHKMVLTVFSINLLLSCSLISVLCSHGLPQPREGGKGGGRAHQQEAMTETLWCVGSWHNPNVHATRTHHVRDLHYPYSMVGITKSPMAICHISCYHIAFQSIHLMWGAMVQTIRSRDAMLTAGVGFEGGRVTSRISNRPTRKQAKHGPCMARKSTLSTLGAHTGAMCAAHWGPHADFRP